MPKYTIIIKHPFSPTCLINKVKQAMDEINKLKYRLVIVNQPITVILELLITVQFIEFSYSHLVQDVIIGLHPSFMHFATDSFKNYINLFIIKLTRQSSITLVFLFLFYFYFFFLAIKARSNIVYPCSWSFILNKLRLTANGYLKE